MNKDLIKKDINNLKKKLGFFSQNQGFKQRKSQCLFKEGDIVVHKLYFRRGLVNKIIKPSFLEKRWSCEVKELSGEVNTYFEHELKLEQKEENIKGEPNKNKIAEDYYKKF